MVKVELKRKLKADDLETGIIFDEDELIVERGKTDMETLRRIPEACGEINLFYYNIITNGNRIRVNHNGTAEFFPGDENYSYYNKQLSEAGL